MFCGQCGNKNPEDSKFCHECGAILTSDELTLSKIKSDNKNRKIGIIAFTIGIIIASALLLYFLTGRSYKATIDQYFNAQFNADAEAIIELFPEKTYDYILEEAGYDDDEFDEFIDEGNEVLLDMLNDLEKYAGKDYDISYFISSIKNINGVKFDKLKDDYQDMDIKISDAKTIELTIQYYIGTEMNKQTERNQTISISVIKIGHSWYLDILTMKNIF